MAKECRVCGEEIESLKDLTEWIIDDYGGDKVKYSLHSSCMSEVTISGLN